MGESLTKFKSIDHTFILNTDGAYRSIAATPHALGRKVDSEKRYVTTVDRHNKCLSSSCRELSDLVKGEINPRKRVPTVHWAEHDVCRPKHEFSIAPCGADVKTPSWAI